MVGAVAFAFVCGYEARNWVSVDDHALPRRIVKQLEERTKACVVFFWRAMKMKIMLSPSDVLRGFSVGKFVDNLRDLCNRCEAAFVDGAHKGTSIRHQCNTVEEPVFN